MERISRRQFVAKTSMAVPLAACVSGGAPALRADPLGIPVGCQIFPVRKELVQDFDGVLRQLHAIGYRIIEFCSPPGFARMDLAPLMSMSASELRRRIEDAGLRTTSCHYQYRELMEHIDERIEFAKELGLEHMVVATVGRPKDLDGWRQRADDLNMLGEKAKKGGLQLGFHNHGQEFDTMEGVLVFDELMRRFDKELVKSQFQVSILSKGHNPVDILKKYPGRFISLHLQDWKASTKGSVPIGQGEIDWKGVFTAAKDGGIQYYFVEMNMDALKASYPYLHNLEV